MDFTFREFFKILVIFTLVYLLLLSKRHVIPKSGESRSKSKMSATGLQYSNSLRGTEPASNTAKESLNTVGQLNCSTKVHRGMNYSIIYNVMPKTGSRTFTGLMHRITKKSSERRPILLTPKDKQFRRNSSLLREFYKSSSRKAVVVRGHNVFVPHFEDNLIYLNTVREPIPWIVSFYYYMKNGDENVPLSQETDDCSFDDCIKRNLSTCVPDVFNYLRYFCGDSQLCRTEEALRISQANFDSFLVIGLTEDFGAFIQLVEKFLPDLCHGIFRKYEETLEILHNQTRTKAKQEPSKETIRILLERPDVQLMYKFYNFAKERFQLLKRCL